MAKKKKQVKWSRTNFGMAANFDVPPGCNVIVLATMGGADNCLRPRRILLPHQIYKSTVRDILKETGATEIWALPYSSDAAIHINPKK